MLRYCCFAAALGIIVMVSGCERIVGGAPEDDGLAYFGVQLQPLEQLGSSEQPLPQRDGYSFTMSITARGRDKQVLEDYAGTVEVRLQGAKLMSLGRLDISGGKVEGVPVVMRLGAGKEVVTVHEVKPHPSSQGFPLYRDTGILGVSQFVYLPPPTIEMLQGIHDESPATGFLSRYDHRNVTVRGGQMMAIAVIEGGFYLCSVPETAAGEDPTFVEHGCIYLYTYSTPYVADDYDRFALEAGTMIEEINGSVFEFFGFTEMSFPTFEPSQHADGSVVIDRPLLASLQPIDITAAIDAQDFAELEKWESCLVTVRNVTVADFDEDDASYLEFAQFPLQTENGQHIMAVTIGTAPAFDPAANVGQQLSQLTGMLKQHRAARPSTYIIVPRSMADIQQ